MGTATLLTLERFLALPEDDCRHELDEGVLIVSPPSGDIHGGLCSQVNHVLRNAFKHQRKYRVVSDCGFILTENPFTVRAPDVAVVKRARSAQKGQNPYMKGAPELAIEVLSPSDTASNIRKKVRQYLKAGALSVWVLDPDTQEVEVHQADGTVRIHASAGTLRAPELSPELAVAVAELFAD